MGHRSAGGHASISHPGPLRFIIKAAMSAASSPSPSVNRQWVLASRPTGLPKESDFRVVETPVPVPSGGELLLQTAYLSVDPYMRGRIAGVKTYADPVLPGDLMVGACVGRVVRSNNPGFQEGDWAVGYWGWQEFFVSNGCGLQKLDPNILPVSTALGILGGPGMTAYFGFLELCQPKPGETVVVSGAAGAVGSAVGQIARIQGCRVIGIAGADDKSRTSSAISASMAPLITRPSPIIPPSSASSAPTASTAISTTPAAPSPMPSSR